MIERSHLISPNTHAADPIFFCKKIEIDFLQNSYINSYQLNKMATSNVERELYQLTRSEATILVGIFMKAQVTADPLDILQAFRDDLRIAKPAYLGVYNNSRERKFYQIADGLYKVVKELNRAVDDQEHHVKIMRIAKILPCAHFIAYVTTSFLNWAVYNWHAKDVPIVEYLGDNCVEYNNCTICGYTGDNTFYFSTSYGLEEPVCEQCVQPELDYDEEEASEGEASEADASEADTEGASEAGESDEDDEESDASEADQDEEYTPSDEEESEEEESGEDESGEDDDVIEIEPEPAVVHFLDDEEDVIRITIEADDEEEEDEEEEEEGVIRDKFYGCDGCELEWRDGWKRGWIAAMKHIRKYMNRHKYDKPEPPFCEYCDVSHGDLKKCSGGCGGVRYCSYDCQTQDWPEHKKICKNTSS